MTRVRLPLLLRRHASGVDSVDLACDTVEACLAELEHRFPDVARQLRDESGELLPAVNLYLNGEDIRYLAGPRTPLSNGDELAIVVAIAGGATSTE